MAKKSESGALILVAVAAAAVAGYMYKDKILAAVKPAPAPAPAPVESGEGGGFGIKPPGLPYEPMGDEPMGDAGLGGGIYAGGSKGFDETAGGEFIDKFGVRIGGAMPVLKGAVDYGSGVGFGVDLFRRWL